MNTLSRGSFLKTAGVATGAAAITASPAVAAALQPGALETTPSGPLPHERRVGPGRKSGAYFLAATVR